MSKFGQRNSRAAKLTVSQVIEMRRLYAESNVSQGQLARDFDVSVVQVGRIVRGEVWQHLEVMPTKEQLELTGKRMLDLQNTLKTMSPQEKMVHDYMREREKNPDVMLEELATPAEERDATEADKRYFTLIGSWPPGVRVPKESTD